LKHLTTPEPPSGVHGFELLFGVQICSDINRPKGSDILVACGAAAIINPSATQSATIDRWRLVLRAVAMTTATYVLSVNRPRPEVRCLAWARRLRAV
jgi:predicted amidohydrolase